MKNLILIAMTAAALTIFIGCQKEDELLNYKDESNLSDTEYAYNKLSVIGFNVLKDSKNSKFRNQVYSKVNEKFDDDFEVLVKDLEISHQNSNLKSAINSDLLEAFKEIDDNFKYPLHGLKRLLHNFKYSLHEMNRQLHDFKQLLYGLKWSLHELKYSLLYMKWSLHGLKWLLHYNQRALQSVQ